MIPTYYNLPDAYRDDDYGPISLRVRNGAYYVDFSSSTKIDLEVRNPKNRSIVVKWSNADGTAYVYNDTQIVLSKKYGNEMLMPPGEYDYDLQVKINDSSTTYLRGKFKVLQDVTFVN